MTSWLFNVNFHNHFDSSLWSFRFLVQEIFCGFLSFYAFFFQDLSENHPGESLIDTNYYCYYYFLSMRRGALPFVAQRWRYQHYHLFILSLISIMSMEKQQTIIVSIYVFSVVLNISNVCHWNQFYICSLGVNFLQNFSRYRATRVI